MQTERKARLRMFEELKGKLKVMLCRHRDYPVRVGQVLGWRCDRCERIEVTGQVIG
jgi:hypothetical protein